MAPETGLDMGFRTAISTRYLAVGESLILFLRLK